MTRVSLNSSRFFGLGITTGKDCDLNTRAGIILCFKITGDMTFLEGLTSEARMGYSYVREGSTRIFRFELIQYYRVGTTSWIL